jgi:DNA (cytosine-5)-methyltransferase 1
MNELALFAGAGGGILGGHLLGWRTVCAVEWEAYPASVLVARQNDKILPPFPIWDDVQTFDGKPWRGIVDVVSGGFPCQDISAAGGGAGIDGKRSGMWREMARIIGEVRPKYAFVENSPMLTSRGLGTVLRDLAEMGYDAEWGVLGAADVGANHQRDRIWLLAYSNSKSNAQRRFDSSISEIGGQRSSDKGRSRGNVDGILKSSSNEEMDTKQRDILSYTEHNRVGWGEQQSESIKETNGRHSLRKLADTDLCRHLHGQTEINTTIREFDAFGKSEPSSSEMANSVEFGIQSKLSNKRKTSKWIDGNGDAKGKEFTNTSGERLEGCGQVWQKNNEIRENSELWRTIAEHSWWSVEPNVGRVAHGVADRVDRLKAIGNGQVPLCAATAWTILMERINES